MRAPLAIGLVALAGTSFAVTRLLVRAPADDAVEAVEAAEDEAPAAAPDRQPGKTAAPRFEQALQALAQALATDAGPTSDPGARVPVPETLSPLQEATVKGGKPEERWAAWRLRTDLTMAIDQRIARCWEKRRRTGPIAFEVRSQIRTAGAEVIAAGANLSRVVSDELPSAAERSCIDDQIRGEHRLPNGDAIVAALGQISTEETVVVRSP